MVESILLKYSGILFLSIGLFSCAQESVKTEINGISDKEQIRNQFNADRKNEFEFQKNIAKNFLAKNRTYNQDLVFLLDMRIPSRQFRFFVHDLKKDSIIHKGLVAHGSGSEIDGVDSLIFSNVPNSYQSSLGKYKIGGKYTGNFGKSYKLHGLDTTNSNAFKRYVVLHPYSAVPDEEQNYPIMLSLGCPMVSDNFMKTLYGIIDSSKLDILMVMYY